MASIQGIYIALFGRPADPSGLAYWNGVSKNGQDLSALYGRLTAEPEYLDLAEGMTPTQLINSIYQKLYDRDADPVGLAGFLKALQDGTQTIESIAINILDGAQGADLARINAKIAAGDLFTAHLDLDAEVNAYKGEAAADIGRAYIDGVNETTPATENKADAAILQLFPDQGGGQGGGGGGGGGSGGANPDFSTMTLQELLDTDPANMPVNYNLSTEAGTEVVTASVENALRIADILANATNAADYEMSGGYDLIVEDTLANLSSADGTAALGDASRVAYELTDVSTDLGDLDLAESILAYGADNFAADGYTFDIVDTHANIDGHIPFDVYHAAESLTVNGGVDAETMNYTSRENLFINGGGGADTIKIFTGFSAAEKVVIDGGAGVDSITLVAGQGADDIVLATSAANRDTIANFQAGTDDLIIADADVTANISLGITAGTYSNQNAIVATTVDLSAQATAANAVVEITRTLSNYADLGTSTNGSELLNGFDTVFDGYHTNFVVSNDWSGFLVAYDNNNAYVYYADANGNTTLTTNEISLVATITGVAAGSLSAADFIAA